MQNITLRNPDITAPCTSVISPGGILTDLCFRVHWFYLILILYMLNSVSFLSVQSDDAFDVAEMHYSVLIDNILKSFSLDWNCLSIFQNDALSLWLPKCQFTVTASAVPHWPQFHSGGLIVQKVNIAMYRFTKTKHTCHLEWRVS
jgi:hypothetical protein